MALVLLLLLALIPINEVEAAKKKVTSVTITNVTNKKLTLEKGRTFSLKTTVKPSNASNKKLKWTSSNSKIVTVSSKGKLKAKKNGTAKITARTTDGSNKKITITVTVGQPVKSIQITNSGNMVSVGNSFLLKTKVNPTKASNKAVAYSSSDKKIATVSSKGAVKAVGVPKGKSSATATITVKSTDGSNVKATFKVKVTQPVTGITPKATTVSLQVKDTYQMNHTIAPSNAYNKRVTYSSSNSQIATVSSTGLIKAVKPGKVNITIASTDGSNIKRIIPVTVKADGITEEVKPSPQPISRFISHMGLNKVAPSNSIPAYEKAGQSGAFMGIEADVRETKDGHFVLYHDNDINTRTDLSGNISNMTLAQVKKATMKKGSNIGLYPELRIPTLNEYLEVCKKYNVAPVLHIKQVSNYQKLIDVLKQHGMYDKAIITASKAVLTKIRQLDPTIQLSWLCYMSVSGIDWAAANNIQINSDYTYVTKELVNYAHSKNLTVGAWTVNSESKINELLEMGVDFITTDQEPVRSTR